MDYSSQYCGIAEMTGPVNDDARPDIFLEKDRYGYVLPSQNPLTLSYSPNNSSTVPIRWIVIKNVPFPRFEKIYLPSGKPVNQMRNAEM